MVAATGILVAMVRFCSFGPHFRKSSSLLCNLKTFLLQQQTSLTHPNSLANVGISKTAWRSASTYWHLYECTDKAPHLLWFTGKFNPDSFLNF